MTPSGRLVIYRGQKLFYLAVEERRPWGRKEELVVSISCLADIVEVDE